MKYESHARTNAQQAPGSGFVADGRHTLRSAPDQAASIRKKRASGGSAPAMSATHTSVRTMLKGPENRLARSQPAGPAPYARRRQPLLGSYAQKRRIVAGGAHAGQRSTIAADRA